MGDHEARPGEADQVAAAAPLGADDIEAGRLLFAQACEFVAGAARFEAIPPGGLPEIAFAGRSNVGKSSLVNALTGRTTLARTSRAPGRTQQLNFFRLGGRLMLVDMPGYGYARVGKKVAQGWGELIRRYLRGRAALRRALVLVDCRHGLKDSDQETMTLLDEAAVSFQVVLTKSDKLDGAALEARIASVAAEVATRPAAHPDVLATSAETGAGIAELRAALASLAALR